MIRNVLVLGSGSAGFVAAITPRHRHPGLPVTALRSKDIGIIGGGEGTTIPVLDHLHGYRRIDQAEFHRIARPTWKLGVRFRLIEDCGLTTQLLFNQGCERVVILWDERPRWPDMDEPLCWSRERARILERLQQAHLTDWPVSLVCVEREFESWLLHDHQLLSALLSRKTRPVRISRQKHPDRMPNPKGQMTTLFRKHGATYVDVRYARRIADALDKLGHLMRCPTFRRFAERVTGRVL